MSTRIRRIGVAIVSIIIFLDGCAFNSSKAVESTKDEITISSNYEVDETSNIAQDTIKEQESIAEKANSTFEGAEQEESIEKSIEENVEEVEETEENDEEEDSDEEAEEDDEEEIDYWSMKFGDAGRLVIEDVGITVALYTAYGEDLDYDQPIIDREDSAAWYDFSSFGDEINGIVDHGDQAFSNLYYVSPKRSVARILHSDGTEEHYICTRVDPNSTNTGYSILDSNGSNVEGLDSDEIYMYTCNSSDPHDITLTFWKRM